MFLQKEFDSAERSVSAKTSWLKKSISVETKAFLQKHPFPQEVIKMQKYFSTISAPSESAETEMFLLLVDLYLDLEAFNETSF